jgi:NAD(P)-dependent dehydrogenase (short-subunit alcohol dehydrogenase family)
MSKPTPQILAQRSFSTADQDWFAALTHDRNPMHVDPLAARRTQFGLPVVHGVHTLLWALDVLGAQRPGFRPAGLQARFVKPVLVGDTVALTVAGDKPGDLTLQVSAGGLPCVTLRLTDAEPRGLPQPGLPEGGPAPAPLLGTARDLPLSDLPEHQGAFHYANAPIAAAFPAAAASLGADAVGGLAAATYVVGMECPGLHSIFGGITAALRGPAAGTPVRFGVTKFDPRFRIMDIALLAPGLTARLSAYGRVPPVAQPGTGDLRGRVGPGSFAGQRALVIGGSRGLGEVTAKLLAAGGADVALTYAAGAADAARVVADIGAAGGQARMLAYDVQKPAEAQLVGLGLEVNALYYFATGTIYRRRTALYEPAIMAEFLAFYVNGFNALAMALRQRTAGKLAAFYPSTVFAAAPTKDFAEYAAAKLAGEMLCAHLAAFGGIETVVARLPRTQTDQTATVTETENASPVEVMLPILHDMQARLCGEGAPPTDALP